MILVCSYCTQPFGVKCPTCGGLADNAIERALGCPDLYQCDECFAVFSAEAGGATHGICAACVALSPAERDLLALARLAAVHQQLETLRAKGDQ